MIGIFVLEICATVHPAQRERGCVEIYTIHIISKLTVKVRANTDSPTNFFGFGRVRRYDDVKVLGHYHAPDVRLLLMLNPLAKYPQQVKLGMDSIRAYDNDFIGLGNLSHSANNIL